MKMQSVPKAGVEVELVPYRPEYLPLFIEWRTQPLSVRYNPLLALSEEEIAQMLASRGSDLADLHKFQSHTWVVPWEKQPVGSVSLKNISHSMGYAEIGYGIAEGHHGKGLATAAISRLIDKVFRETSLRKLLALVHVENSASRRVLTKLGFREEGLLREHYVIQGTPVDEIFYGLLKREWPLSKSD
jgi:ribosomal-protein-alanine N-acetyltransferase